jgi:hypothetical protein
MKATQCNVFGVFLILIGTALALSGVFLLFRPADYQIAARIKILGDFSEAYIMESEFEVIESELILGRVLEKPNLATIGGESRKLTRLEAIERLRKRLELATISDLGVFDIRVSDRDPIQAAETANTIAEAYLQHRREVSANGLKQTVENLEVLQSDTERKLKVTQEDANRLKKELHVPDPEPENLNVEYPTYASAKQRGQELKQFLDIIRQKIAREQTQEPLDWVVIVKRAVAPEKPVRPNRTDGAILLGLDAIISVLGFSTRNSAKHQPPTSPPAPR